MKKRVIKLIVCILLISSLMIGFCSAYASAATPVWLLRAKAGIAAALFASNLFINPVNAAVDDYLLDVVDPLGYVMNIQDTPWTDYIDRSVITVRPDVVTIDGVSYSDIWIGPDAADSLRLSGLDFVSEYNILNNQSTALSYAEGVGTLEDIPIYNVNGVRRTPYYSCGFGQHGFNSDCYAVFTDASPGHPTIQFVSTQNYINGVLKNSGTGSYNKETQYVSNIYFLRNVTTYGSAQFCSGAMIQNGIPQVIATSTYETSNYSNDPFSFDYTSGVIDAPVDPDDGLLLRVPSSYTDSDPTYNYNYDIHDLINIYPQVNDTNGHELIFDPSLNPDFDVDLDMGNALGDIITAIIIAKLADLLGDDAEIIYAPFPEKEPVPAPDPDTPDPDVPIGDQDPIWLDDLMRWIKNAIDNLGHTIRDVVDTIHEDLQEIIQSLSELPDKILEEIELGPAKLIDKALDILKTLLMPLLLPIRAMMNLWHYVVEWLTSIATPFFWIFGIMAATSYNMVLPIYALLAGGICIAIYKVFGR